ncbi:hypothetical protein B4135_3815 [Caldibacillus debilis]|uniref:Uncharacterized protein n=1 Tax=Caldibacillus debilis TaxID=301148 RepID=A0A150LAX0_9BACI|nr:hypothetical protein B4135_3815 [Caldibacillus debilis]
MAERSSVFFERISLIYCTQIPGIFHPPFFRGGVPAGFSDPSRKKDPLSAGISPRSGSRFPDGRRKRLPPQKMKAKKKPPFSQKRQAPADIPGKRPFKKESARSRFPLC